MKAFLLIACLFGAACLMGCVTTQTHTAHTPTAKADAKQAKSSGTYLGGGIGLGVVAF